MSDDREIWFARGRSHGRGGARMVPVHWKGYAAFGVFAGAMLFGGLIFAACAYAHLYALGIIIYVLSAMAGVGAIIFAIVRHGDATRSSDEFRNTHA